MDPLAAVNDGSLTSDDFIKVITFTNYFSQDN